MADDSKLAVGWPVFSNDGQHLGHVKEVGASSEWFKVDAPATEDYWLPLGVILQQENGVALLKLTHSEVMEQKKEGGEPRDTMLSPRGTRLDPGDPN